MVGYALHLVSVAVLLNGQDQTVQQVSCVSV